ncbi:MAG: InlB B-repeat-containing protein [Spirochaetales bacterium]|nr:InlB B-repeat-containing protein [Spirochaetales bacterium]
MRTRKTLVVSLMILCLACAAVFANAELEKIKVEKETEKYSALDLENASFESIMEAYQAELDAYNTKYESIREKMVQSYNEGNVEDYFDAKGMLRNLAYPTITAEDTEVLVKRIAESKDDASEFAAWLYDNSMFYRPVITLTKASDSDDGESRKSSFRYSYTISMEPGSTVTLPSMNVSFTSDGVFAGWGTTEDEVTYEAGSEITMPYSDLTLYAVFKSGVMFYDYITETEVFEDSSDISAPVLEAPDESYVFDGWYNESGEKVEGPVSIEDGQSAAFYAGWKSVLVDDVRIKNKGSMSVTADKEYKLSFSVMNQGSISTGNLTIELVPESDAITVLSDSLSTDNIRAMHEKSGSFAFKVSGASGDVVKANIVVTDADGNSWKTPVELTVK